MPALKNAKHEAVLQAFLADPKRVGWRAWQAVYPKSSRGASQTAWSRALKIADFAARLEELKTKVATEVAHTIAKSAQDVFDELVKIGFSNVQDFFDEREGFVGIKNLTRDQAASIASMKIETVIEDGHEPVGETQERQAHGGSLKRRNAKPLRIRRVEFKLHDKRAALVDLGRHFGLFTPKKDQPEPDKSAGEPDARPVTDLDAARRVAFLLSKAAKATPAPKGRGVDAP